MLKNLLPIIKGSLPYIYATFITAICLIFMWLGKLDASVGIGIIATMGLGSCMHKSTKTQIQAIDTTPQAPIEPPCPQDCPAESPLIGVTK